MDVMIDLETLGTRPGSVILSVGAAAFGASGVMSTFHAVVWTQSCLDAGLTTDEATIVWWKTQSLDAARTWLDAADEKTSASIGKILRDFDDWIFGLCGNYSVIRPWGNGAAFDLPILAEAYRRCGFGAAPWKHYNERCYRTLKNLRPDVTAPERAGTHHHALDDAVHQAKHAVALLAAL